MDTHRIRGHGCSEWLGLMDATSNSGQAAAFVCE
jgi:hypothetical protein